MSDPFHQHLDVCKQCADHPFDLCAEGAKLIREVALGLSPTGRAPSEPHLQSIPIRTELGQQVRAAFNATFGSVLVHTNYSATEMRVAASLTQYVCAECGCETNTSMGKPCGACGSIRVVLRSFVEEHFGPNWRDAFKEPSKS